MQYNTKNIKVQEFVELKKYTTMYVGGIARFFVEVFSEIDLKEALIFSKENNLNIFILGGGSNVIVSDAGFDGLVIKMSIKGVSSIKENIDSVIYEVGAGENWDEFVNFCVKNNLYGFENLSHIPGTVGASVVQNIGAYGVEVGGSVVSVKVMDINDFRTKIINGSDMYFSYRKSRLNDPKRDKGRYVVQSVSFKLKRQGELFIKYDDIKRYFDKKSQKQINLKNIREAIIEIRNNKFPFPDSPEHGTVGSFWNADPVDRLTYESIIKKLESKGLMDKADLMRNKKNIFEVSSGYKVPYGILIESLGFKGKVCGGVKVLETHAGVINNFTGKGGAQDVLCLSNEVINAVRDEFGVCIKVEPEFIGEFK